VPRTYAYVLTWQLAKVGRGFPGMFSHRVPLELILATAIGYAAQTLALARSRDLHFVTEPPAHFSADPHFSAYAQDRARPPLRLPDAGSSPLESL
jgi:hypothetical protein